jgi:hypothetical protein
MVHLRQEGGSVKRDANDVAGELGPEEFSEDLAKHLAKAEREAEPSGGEASPETRETDEESAAAPPEIVNQEPWPAALHPDALYGLPGEIVRTIEPHTESDPVALLVQLLVAFGNCIGRGAHWTVNGGVRHFSNLFVVLVGRTAKGRKGTSWGEIQRLFSEVGKPWLKNCVKNGLSSAEGLIWQIRDPIMKWSKKELDFVVDDPGIEDKRLLLVESEFAQVLKQAERSGNTLSPVIRQAWDQGNLECLTKNSPAKATGAHVSIVGHITKHELRRYLSSTDMANGLANRIVWVCTRRSKELPLGGKLQDIDVAVLRGELLKAVTFAASKNTEIKMDAAATDLWCKEYSNLSAEREGLAAAVCGRAEPQVMRIAMLYALMDLKEMISVEHLRAALAVWRYCEESARCIFGDAMGDATADELLAVLRRTPDGMTRNDIRDYFNRNKSAGEIARALTTLAKQGLAKCDMDKSEGGRRAERWKSV